MAIAKMKAKTKSKAKSKIKRTRGRPRIIDREDLLAKLLEYIDKTTIPILAEFAYSNNVLRERLYVLPELEYAIKRCRDKKEASLERECLKGKINKAMAIFSLKQLGWTDKNDLRLEHSGYGGAPMELLVLEMTREERQTKIEELLAKRNAH